LFEPELIKALHQLVAVGRLLPQYHESHWSKPVPGPRIDLLVVVCCQGSLPLLGREEDKKSTVL
jgi:hypothetical protein